MSQTTKMLQAGCFLATNSLCFRSLDEIKDSFHRISNSPFSKGLTQKGKSMTSLRIETRGELRSVASSSNSNFLF